MALEATRETDHVGQIPLDWKTRQKLSHGHTESMAEPGPEPRAQSPVTPVSPSSPLGCTVPRATQGQVGEGRSREQVPVEAMNPRRSPDIRARLRVKEKVNG